MEFVSLLYFVGIFNGLLLVAILFSPKFVKYKANLFLGFFTLIITGYLFEQFLTIREYIASMPHLIAMFVPLFLLLGPLYYFYVKTMIVVEYKFKKIDLIHFAPALICLIMLIPYFILPGEVKIQQLLSFDISTRHEKDSNKFPYHLIFFIQSMIYALFTIKYLDKKIAWGDGRSTRMIISVTKWLRVFSIVFIAFISSYILIFSYISFIDVFVFALFWVYNLLTSVFVCFIGFWTISKFEFLNNYIQKKELVKAEDEDLKNKITRLFEEDNIFADSELNLHKLAQLLDTNTQYLSKYINNNFNCSFSFLVNSYRISMSKKLIKDPSKSHLSLLGIAMEVGFNTKNTFTRAFRKHCGMTPSEYKKT